MKVEIVIGARPNVMKAVPLYREFLKCSSVKLVQTGQHDPDFLAPFFRQFGLDSSSMEAVEPPTTRERSARLGEMVSNLSKRFVVTRPDLVVVVGDVDSTLAAALAAKYAGIRLAHVEAGLRSGDSRMPEELNRRAVDAFSDLKFVSEPSGLTNLDSEGLEKGVFLVGNVMIDTLKSFEKEFTEKRAFEQYGLSQHEYVLMTLHRPELVCNEALFKRTLERIANAVPKPILWPTHPRINSEFVSKLGFRVIPPVPYLEMLSLVTDSCFVLTDSGGLQEETSVLSVPCITVRNNTERPVTITKGTNQLIGENCDFLENALLNVGVVRKNVKIDLWDGYAASRIREIVERELK